MSDQQQLQSEPRSSAAAATSSARRLFPHLPRHRSFVLLCVVMGLESIAANMVHPVEPAFFIQLGLPDYVFGVAYAAMALGLFSFAPLWGVISDRVGRIPVLAIGALTYGLAQLLFVASHTVATIVAARFLAGAFCSGCLSAGMAYVADVSEPAKRGKRMAVYGAVVNLCTAGGFLLGGVIGKDVPQVSFVAQFFVLALTGALAYVLMDEGSGFHRSQKALRPADANPLAAFAGARHLMSPWMMAFLAASLLAALGDQAFGNAFNYYLRDQFQFPTTYNGAIYAITGLLGFAANITIGMRLQGARRVERPLTVVLGMSSVVLLASLLAHSMGVYLGIVGVYFVLSAMYLPLMQAMAVQGDSSHGVLSGVFQSSRSMGGVLGALIAGFIYTPAPRSPFGLAAGAFALAAVAAVLCLRAYRCRAT